MTDVSKRAGSVGSTVRKCFLLPVLLALLLPAIAPAQPEAGDLEEEVESGRQMLMPYLSDMTPREAADSLGRMGLQVKKVSDRSADTTLHGRIVKTEPGNREPIQPGQRVTIFVGAPLRSSVPPLYIIVGAVALLMLTGGALYTTVILRRWRENSRRREQVSSAVHGIPSRTMPAGNRAWPEQSSARPAGSPRNLSSPAGGHLPTNESQPAQREGPVTPIPGTAAQSGPTPNRSVPTAQPQQPTLAAESAAAVSYAPPDPGPAPVLGETTDSYDYGRAYEDLSVDVASIKIDVSMLQQDVQQLMAARHETRDAAGAAAPTAPVTAPPAVEPERIKLLQSQLESFAADISVLGSRLGQLEKTPPAPMPAAGQPAPARDDTRMRELTELASQLAGAVAKTDEKLAELAEKLAAADDRVRQVEEQEAERRRREEAGETPQARELCTVRELTGILRDENQRLKAALAGLGERQGMVEQALQSIRAAAMQGAARLEAPAAPASPATVPPGSPPAQPVSGAQVSPSAPVPGDLVSEFNTALVLDDWTGFRARYRPVLVALKSRPDAAGKTAFTFQESNKGDFWLIATPECPELLPRPDITRYQMVNVRRCFKVDKLEMSGPAPARLLQKVSSAATCRAEVEGWELTRAGQLSVSG